MAIGEICSRVVICVARDESVADAARVMRGLVIDAVRRRQAEKRGGGFEITGFDGHEEPANPESESLAALSDALDDLSRLDPELVELVDLKYFCGFSFAEIAAMRGVSERTVQRHWEKARLYLYRAIGDVAQLERR